MNTILAGGSPNCDSFDGAILDNGNNFAEDDSCGPGFSDITAGEDFDPSLTDNGGPTPTHALLPGSVAIDAGGDCAIETDQRGFPRDDGECDSGAFEFQGGGDVPASSPLGLLVLPAILMVFSAILRRTGLRPRGRPVPGHRPISRHESLR